MTVVDLCCGDGHFTAPLAELVNGKVYALDIDPGMLNQARLEVARRERPLPSGFAPTRRILLSWSLTRSITS
jgi:predicted RNA methylase